MSEDGRDEGSSNPTVPGTGDEEGGSDPTVPDSGHDEGSSGPSVPDSGDDEGSTGPTVPGSDDESGTGERTDASAGDVHDPAGVGARPEDDATGLSGQPDADEFEGSADWSDVDDSTAVEAETHIETDRQGGSEGPQTPPQGGGTGRAQAGGHAEGPGTAPASGGTGAQRATGEKYCSNCGTVISQQAVICPDCGVEQTATSQSSGSNDSDPAVAALLSGIGLLFPIATGAGQVYNGQVGKGVAFSLLQMVNAVLIFVLIGLVTYPLLGFFAIYDAYSNAEG